VIRHRESIWGIGAWWCKLPTIATVGTLALYLAHESGVNRRIQPPSENCTLADLAKRLPPPIRLAVVTQHGEQRLVWVGPVPPFSIRSGPPCYIFDGGCRLVDWCPETGEGWPLEYMRAAAFREKPTSLNDALRWCDSGD
jgi:hypothetical protein